MEDGGEQGGESMGKDGGFEVVVFLQLEFLGYWNILYISCNIICSNGLSKEFL